MNPYTVLGLTPSASDAEVKSAYRALAKKYHPDKYANDAVMAAIAAERMKEINEAAGQIKALRSLNGQQNVYDQEGNAERDQFEKFPEDKNFLDSARESINKMDLDSADDILLAIPEDERDGEWWFCYAVITERRGWLKAALEFYKRACNLKPDDPEFALARDRLYSRSSVVAMSKALAAKALSSIASGGKFE